MKVRIMAHLEAFSRGSKNSRNYLYAKIFLALKILISAPFSELSVGALKNFF